jgi:hypothetical protein
MVEFRNMIRVLEQLGTVSEGIPKNKLGKPTKFIGEVTSRLGSKKVRFGLLHFPWNRPIGVNKINQAVQFVNQADVDGAIIIGGKFTSSAIEQAFRNNEVTDKRILLLDNEEISAAFELLND